MKGRRFVSIHREGAGTAPSVVAHWWKNTSQLIDGADAPLVPSGAVFTGRLHRRAASHRWETPSVGVVGPANVRLQWAACQAVGTENSDELIAARPSDASRDTI